MTSDFFIPDPVLKAYGCANCVWKGTPSCPKGFTKPDETTPDGYCDELLQFLLSLRQEGESLSAVKEKFFIYTQELQALKDGVEFKQLQELLSDEKNVSTATMNPDALHAHKQKLAEINSALNMSKLWWARLSESVTKGLSRIVDRESRAHEKLEIDHKISLTQIHQLAQAAVQKQIESGKDDTSHK